MESVEVSWSGLTLFDGWRKGFGFGNVFEFHLWEDIEGF